MKTWILMFVLALVIGATTGAAAGWMYARHGAGFGWLLLGVMLGGVLLIDWGRKDDII